MKLAVLGAGAWGTALAISFAARHQVSLWARDREQAAEIDRSRRNARYLPGFSIPAELSVSSDLELCLRDCEAAVCAVPTQALRAVLGIFGRRDIELILACKGLERDSSLLPHEIARSVLGSQPPCVLSGPSFAREVARGLPTAVVLACTDAARAARLARDLHAARLRIYSTEDTIGVEVAGAAKNVMAIAAGVCDGLELGLNARAALISRGLAEISRLGLELGGRIETFMGLAGAGDLILTCTGDLSRNRTVGLQLASGISIDRILASLGHVAEGVSTAHAIDRLAARLAIEMPITRSVCQLLAGQLTPAAAVNQLMDRDPKAEF